MNGMSALIKRTPGGSLTPSALREAVYCLIVCNQERGLFQNPTLLASPQTVRRTFLLLQYFVIAGGQEQDTGDE